MRQNGRSLYVVFLAAIAAVPAMATDMYLAAMPIIARQWGVTDSHVALSLVLWFVGFSVFLLIFGPLSDKYGRRPILLIGLALFTVATAACAVTTSVGQLIAFRILQGIGSASSFIVFYQFMVGAVCMRIVTAPWQAPIRVFGLLALLAPVVVLAIWPLLLWLLKTPGERESSLRTAPQAS